MNATTGEIANPPSPVRLRTGALSLIETVGQSLSAMAPTITPTLSIAVVAGLAGIGCWLSYLIGTLGIMIVAASVGIMASRHPQAGSYFLYIGRSFGPFAGALAGWAMISAYLFTGVAALLSFPIFLGDFLNGFGIRLHLLSQELLMLAFIGIVTYVAYRDVKFSSRAGLILEAISVGIILVITATFVRLQGTVIDPAQLQPSSFSFSGVMSGLPFVIFCFVGFESAATMAKESANPRRNVPLAVVGVACFAGIFFTVMAYFMVFGIGNDVAALGRSAAPFGEVAAKAGLGWASLIVYCAAMISVFACCLACLNAVSRLLYSMGRYRFVHHSMGQVHDTHRTPHRAILLCGGALAAISLAVSPVGFLNAYGYTGTFASFSFIGVYLALCVVAPLDLKKSREMKPLHALFGIVGAALMLFVIVSSVYPVPPHPYDLLPYLFFLYMLVGAIWFAMLRVRSPQTLASIQHDMEG
jgi:amino acid transporter